MKKILAIAIATAISAPAMADLTIGGSADWTMLSSDGNVDTAIETNIDVKASAEAANGLFVKYVGQIEMINADQAATANPEVDDNYIQVGTADAYLTAGNFVGAGVYVAGNDDYMQGANSYKGATLERAGDLALNVNASGVSLQLAVNADENDTIEEGFYRLVATTTVGAVKLGASYEKGETTAAVETTGYAVSAATSFEDVAVAVSYAEEDNSGASTSTINVGYKGLDLNVASDDTGSATETHYYGSYNLGDMGVAGAKFIVGAGADDDASKFGVNVQYAF